MTMKVFLPRYPILSHGSLECCWLEEHSGIALMDKINQGLEGEVAKRISAWAQITPAELRKMSGIPNTAFNRSIRIGLQPTRVSGSFASSGS
ncbi:Uncharacterized conserved protein [Enterobacter kobei]|nr:Uncharacterized conserved protein [Enterobacter kobei]